MGFTDRYSQKRAEREPEFRELVGVKQPLISRLENGTQNITVNTLQSILARTNTGAKLTISVEEKELVHQ